MKRLKENEQNYQGTQVLKMHTKFSRKSRGVDTLLKRPRRSREDIIKIGLTGIGCMWQNSTTSEYGIMADFFGNGNDSQIIQKNVLDQLKD